MASIAVSPQFQKHAGPENAETLSIEEFEGLRSKIRAEDTSIKKTPLIELMQGSKLTFPKKESPKPTEYLEKRRKYLALREEERAYHILAKNISGTSRKQEGVAKMIPKLSIGINMILAMATMFIAGYVASGSIFDHMGHRMACGLVCMVGIMIIEMTLFVIRDTKEKSD